MRDRGVLNRVVNVCSKVIGVRQTCLNELYERRVARKGQKIASDISHVLANNFVLLPSGRRYSACRLKSRAAKSFIPTCIQLLNKRVTVI